LAACPVTKSGRRFFLVENGTVWELIDAYRNRQDQAATFAAWCDI
jgi:hypothetical protein